MHIYRNILSHAASHVMHDKRLWIFGLFAGLLNTGSVIDSLVQLTREAGVLTSPAVLFVRAVPGLTSFLTYLHTLSLLAIGRAAITGGLVISIFAVVLLLSLNGQANLFHYVKERRKRLAFWHPSGATLVRLFVVNLFSRVVLAVMSVLGSMILTTLGQGDFALRALVTFAVLVVTIPFALLFGALTIFAMIEIVTKGKVIVDAYADAWQIIRYHLTAVMEVAVLLFLVGLLGTLVLMGAMILFAIPYFLLIIASLALKSLVLWSLVLVFGGVVLVSLILLFGALFTSFVYTTWFLTYQKFSVKTKVVSKIERILKHVQRLSFN